jgi:hypothetical protein
MKVALGAAALLLMTLLAGSAHAQAVEKGSFGVGLVIGEPTGVSAKLYLDDDNAVQAAAGSAFVGGGLQVHADYLWHPWILEERDSFTLPAYVGPGARFIYYQQGRDGEDFVAIGARAVAGIVFDFKEIPLDVFVEVAGVVEYKFAPVEDEKGWGLALNAGLGARYYF